MSAEMPVSAQLPVSAEASGAGRYTIQAVLGRGSFGTVFRARYQGELGLARDVALKVLNPEQGRSEETGRRLRNEARLLSFLRHPAIVGVDRLARLEGRWAVVMQLVDGMDLGALGAEGPLPLRILLQVGARVAGALAFAWRAEGPGGQALRVLHRNLKPPNVLVTTTGEVKVLDFGVARAGLDALGEAAGRPFVGRPEYTAPERLDGEDGPPGDVYALGALLAELLLGAPLGPGDRSRPRHEAMLAERLAVLAQSQDEPQTLLAELLAVMLAWDPNERPSASECEEALAALAEEVPGPLLPDWAEDQVIPLLHRRREEEAQQLEHSPELQDLVLVDELVEPPPDLAPAPTHIPEDEEPPAEDGPAAEDRPAGEGEPVDEPEPELPAEGRLAALLLPASHEASADQRARADQIREGRGLAAVSARRQELGEAERLASRKRLRLIAGAAVALGVMTGLGLALLLHDPPPPPEPVEEVVPLVEAPGTSVPVPEEGELAEPVQASSGGRSGSKKSGPRILRAPSGGGTPLGEEPPMVSVAGDADAVYLSSASAVYKLPGSVPAGRYSILAVFAGGERSQAGSASVPGNKAMTVECRTATSSCKTR